jgi:hypothetical protein
MIIVNLSKRGQKMTQVLQLPPFTKLTLSLVAFRAMLLLALLVGTSPEIEAQRSISVTDFFALGNLGLMVAEGRNAGKAPNMPWFEEYQLRTETRDFELDQQEYTFRMAPSTGRKRRALTSLYNHQESAPDFEAQESRCDALAQRYADWLELYLIDKELAILTRLQIILQDRTTVLSRQAGSLDFDWSKLVQLRESTTDLDVRASRLNTKQAQVTNNLGIMEPAFSFSGFISVAEIGAGFPGGFKLAADPKLDYELETVARELELEEAERRQYFDFAQVKYRGPHTDLPRERFSVGLAFQLPNSGEKQVKIRELELEELSLRKEQTEALAGDKADYFQRVAAWQIDFQHFSFMAKTYQQEREEMLRIGEQLKKKQGFNPLPLLDIEERSLRNELKLLAIKADIYQNYLEIRERAGELCGASQGGLLVQ